MRWGMGCWHWRTGAGWAHALEGSRLPGCWRLPTLQQTNFTNPLFQAAILPRSTLYSLITWGPFSRCWPALHSCDGGPLRGLAIQAESEPPQRYRRGAPLPLLKLDFDILGVLPVPATHEFDFAKQAFLMGLHVIALDQFQQRQEGHDHLNA